jgi:hypothetical protein
MKLGKKMSNNQSYWLCCGSTDYTKHKSGCNEREMGHTDRCRFGTAEQHRATMVSVPKEQIDFLLMKASIELIQKVDRLVNLIESEIKKAKDGTN